MAGSILNRQPVFTATPKIVATNPRIYIPDNKMDNPTNLSTIYTDNSTYGSLITRITVTGVCDLAESISKKAIYLYIKDPTNGIVVLYQTKVMDELASRTDISILPSVSFDLGGGISTTTGTVFKIGAGNSSSDKVAVVVESGQYEYA